MSPDWSKIGRSSRRKGHSFERLAAKKLNQILGSNFVRTPASGGHAIEGDLYEPPHKQTEWSNFTFYCRTGCDFSWASLLEGKEVGPLGWIKLEKTNPEDIWLFRGGPGQFFVCVHKFYLNSDFNVIEINNYLELVNHRIFDIKFLPQAIKLLP